YYGLPSKDRNGKVIPTVAKDATMDDYWQISKTSTRSGIHLTARDYGKMGTTITKYEETKAHNKTLSLIQSIVGSGPNVIHSISTYFTEGKADPSKTNTLYHYACLRDYDTAEHYFEQARQLLPNTSQIPESLAYVARRRGQWDR